MREGTNQAIFYNSIISYTRLIVTAVSGLFTTRFALQALGVNDFGIFSIVGSIISFIAVTNTVMLSTSNRFIAVAIGKHDIHQINEQFNINLVIHASIALLVLLFAIPIGDWYILKCVNYSGEIRAVVKVYNITIIGSIISFLGVPYNGLLIAKERFLVFSLTDIFTHLVKLSITYSLLFYFDNKLEVYAITNTVLVAIPTLIYLAYCTYRFPNLVHIRLVKDPQKYKAVFSFSVWIAYGAVACIGQTQGAAIIVNLFFNTAMNTALGLANSVNGILQSFAGNVTRAISPQITKAFSSGNIDRSVSLVTKASKISFMFMLLVSSPFFIAPEFIFKLWLGEIPDNVIIFTTLMIIDALLSTLNAGISDFVFATGKIKWYQITINTLRLLSIIVAYFVLRAGYPAYYLIVTYIVFTITELIIRQVIYSRILKMDNWKLIKESYFPSFRVLCCYWPIYFLKGHIHSIVLILISIVYLLGLIYYLGFTSSERDSIKSEFLSFFSRLRQR